MISQRRYKSISFMGMVFCKLKNNESMKTSGIQQVFIPSLTTSNCGKLNANTNMHHKLPVCSGNVFASSCKSFGKFVNETLIYGNKVIRDVKTQTLFPTRDFQRWKESVVFAALSIQKSANLV